MFRDHGFTDFEEQLSGSYRTWEYCVQYRETDFNFVSRLMEQEGIYYYFRHENGKHTLVLSDALGSHEPFPGYAEIAYWKQTESSPGERDGISAWALSKEVQPGKYVLNDFDFKKPAGNLVVNSSIQQSHAAAEFEVYDYPGEYVTSGEGDSYVQSRIQELHSRHEVATAVSSARGISTGCLFELTDHPRSDQNREYLVIGASYTMAVEDYESGSLGGTGSETTYSCTANVIPSDVQFRAARTTRKPIVQGPQTAIVVGKAGEEIWPDEHGRVKVKFHWDRYSQADETSSCWIRVSQSWAGRQWGWMTIPRIGHEVIVEFLEGDPDRPIITGRVYNGTNKPPYALPDNATLSGMKSNSSKGGGGFNEIRFEDKKGQEQIFIHAEKDMDIRVKNDCYEWIGNERHLIVKKNQIELVEKDRSETVKGDDFEEVKKNQNLKVGINRSEEVGGTQSTKVTGLVSEDFGDDFANETKNQYWVKADEIVLEGKTKIIFKVGSTGFEITATDIKSNAPNITATADANMEMKAPMNKVQGDALMTVKGGIVMIN